MNLTQLLGRAARSVTFTTTDSASELAQAAFRSAIPTHDEWLTFAGMYPLSPASALAVPGVQRAVTLITDIGSQIELRQQRRVTDPDGSIRWETLADPYPIVRQPNTLEPAEETVAKIITLVAQAGKAFVVFSAHDPNTGRPAVYEVVEHASEDISIEWSKGSPRHRRYFYRGHEMALWRDIAHIKHTEIPNRLHALGPIQANALHMLGAADVEEWARSYFATGGQHSVSITLPGPGDDGEAKQVKDAWISSKGGTIEPAVLFGGAVAKNESIQPDQAQALETRRWNVQLAANMFGLNPYMLAVAMGGANITYQTLPDLFAEAVRLTVYPTYLRKVERVVSHMLPRHNRARFDLSEFLRADEKTRMATAATAITAGVLTADEVRAREGYRPLRKATDAQQVG